MTSEDLENLRHMVGAVPSVPRGRWGYRNHFAPGGADVASMRRLEAEGFVVRGRPYEDDFYYHATKAAFLAIGLSDAAIKRALGGFL